VTRVAVAASVARPVGLVPVFEELGIARSTEYPQRAGLAQVDPPQKRGPRPIVHDPELLSAIHSVLTDSPFLGEGSKGPRPPALQGQRNVSSRHISRSRRLGLQSSFRSHQKNRRIPCSYPLQD